MSVVHSKDMVVQKSGGFFFVWTMFTLSAAGLFTVLLSARALLLTFRAGRPRLPSG